MPETQGSPMVEWGRSGLAVVAWIAVSTIGMAVFFNMNGEADASPSDDFDPPSANYDPGGGSGSPATVASSNQQPPVGDEATDCTDTPVPCGELAQGCANGVLDDCDRLYYTSAQGSQWESYAATCGGRVQDERHEGRCVAALG